MWKRGKHFDNFPGQSKHTKRRWNFCVNIFSLFTSRRPHRSVLLRFVAVWHGTQQLGGGRNDMCKRAKQKRVKPVHKQFSALKYWYRKTQKKCIAEHWRWDSEKRRRRGGVKSDRRENKTRSINSNSFTMNNNWRNLMKFFFSPFVTIPGVYNFRVRET